MGKIVGRAMEIGQLRLGITTVVLVEAKPGKDVDLKVLKDQGSSGESDVMQLDSSLSPFYRIPGFVVSHLSKEAKVADRTECETVCSDNLECESLSYRARDKRCLWSEGKLHYAAKWKMYIMEVKMGETGLDEPTGEYHMFANLKFSDKPETKPTGGDFETCKTTCARDKNCGTFSYNAATEQCLIASDGVKFDPDFTYYERNKQLTPREKEEAAEQQEKAQQGKLPENVPTQAEMDEEEEEEAKPKIEPPETQRITETMKKQAEKIKELDEELKAPNHHLALNKATEKRKKEEINRSEELKVQQLKQQREVTAKVEAIAAERAKVVKTIAGAGREARGKTLAIAKEAYSKGYQKAEEKGTAAFEEAKKKLLKSGDSGKAKTGSEVQAKEAEHKQKTRERLDKFKEKARQKELADKKSARNRAIDLSRKVAKLVSDEAAAKQAKRKTEFMASQAEIAARDSTIASNMKERNEKKVVSIQEENVREAAQGEFNLQKVKDNLQQLEDEKSLAEQKQKVKEVETKGAERRERQLKEKQEALTTERANKDEIRAASMKSKEAKAP